MQTLKQARVESGYTQEQVAKILQVSASTISRYESNTGGINAYIFARLCKIYNKSVDEIV